MVGRGSERPERIEGPELRIHGHPRPHVAAKRDAGVVEVIESRARIGTGGPDNIVDTLSRGCVRRGSSGIEVLPERDRLHGLGRDSAVRHAFHCLKRIHQILAGRRILEVGVLGRGGVVDQQPAAESAHIADVHQESPAELAGQRKGGVDAVGRLQAGVDSLAPSQSGRVGCARATRWRRQDPCRGQGR